MAQNNQRKSSGAHGGRRKNAGRPKGSHGRVSVLIKGSLTETAKAYTLDMLGVLVGIALDETLPAGARTTAAGAVLDRGHGKATQAVEVSGPDGGPIEHREIGDVERARRVAFLLGLAAKKKG